MTGKLQDTAAFEEAISNLKIAVTRDENGLYTVCSSTEPLFCYDAHDLDAVNKLVIDTLASYGEHFFQIPRPKITTTNSPVGRAFERVEQSVPITYVHPVLGEAA
jgi:hypothetical protein